MSRPNLKLSLLKREVGAVLLDGRAARDDIGHFKSNDKFDTYYAVKDVIEKGRVIENGVSKEGKQSIYIAAPVKVGKRNTVVVALVHSDENNRLYFHWAKSLEELREASKTPPEGHGLTGYSSMQSVSSGTGGVTPSRAPSGSVGYAKEAGTRWATAESDISRRAPSSSVESAEATVSSGAIAGDNQRLNQTSRGVNEELRGASLPPEGDVLTTSSSVNSAESGVSSGAGDITPSRAPSSSGEHAKDAGVSVANAESNSSLSGKDTDVKTLLGVTHKIRAALNAKTDGIIGKLDPITHEPLPSPESGIAGVGASNARPRNDASTVRNDGI